MFPVIARFIYARRVGGVVANVPCADPPSRYPLRAGLMHALETSSDLVVSERLPAKGARTLSTGANESYA